MNALVKVDPKAWFTNERTFLHWLNMSMIISAAGIAAAPAVGYTVSFVSIGVIGLSLYKYAKRMRELDRGIASEFKSDFLDIYSPIMMAGLISLGVIIAIAIAIQNWESSRYS
jgi:uncharacterized membrane protein YidH (DUF202 family)